jgi:hypothetical protein
MFLCEGAQKRLVRTWVPIFRDKIMPLLLAAEDQFRVLYGEVGRPCWSVARMLGCLLLGELMDLSDEDLLDAVACDARYHQALWLRADATYLSRRSLVDFRSRLVRHDPDMELVRKLFDQICAEALSDMKLSTKQQRVDSTWLTSNIRVRGRLGLFRQTVRHFILWMEKDAAEHLERLSEELRNWHATFDDSWEAPRETAKQRPKILRLARWTYELVQEFANDADVCAQEPYQLLVRLLNEQCIINEAEGEGEGGDGDRRVVVSIPESQNKRDGAMRTPHDPDATTSQKGAGYHVQITETCNNDDHELILDYEVEPAHRPDTGRTPDIVERLDERGLKPETLYADGGYPTPSSLSENEKQGVKLHAPVTRQNMDSKKMSRMDFEVDQESGQIIACPEGHAPLQHTIRAATPTRTSEFALFDGARCSACPRRSECPVQSPGKDRPNGSFRLENSPGLHIRDQIFSEQQGEPWLKDYRIRAGVEATMSELKRTHGLERLRVRRLPRVKLSVSFKLMACNIKRWGKSALKRATLSTAPVAQAA